VAPDAPFNVRFRTEHAALPFVSSGVRRSMYVLVYSSASASASD
jgi:hypothetical protein